MLIHDIQISKYLHTPESLGAKFLFENEQGLHKKWSKGDINLHYQEQLEKVQTRLVDQVIEQDFFSPN